MDSFYNSWAHAHRNAKGWGTAIFLLLLLLWTLSETSNERISRQDIEATVIKATLLKDSTTSGGLSLKMADGKTFKIYVSANPFPEVGDKVPLVAELYEDGSKMYMLNQQRWIIYKTSR